MHDNVFEKKFFDCLNKRCKVIFNKMPYDIIKY